MRKYPLGCEILKGGISFRLYAPKCHAVEVALENEGKTQYFPLEAEKNGYFSGQFKEFKNNSHYRFRLNKKEELYPDPASKFQPKGPFGPSCVIDHSDFKWTDQEWMGITIENQIIYELHVGTFTDQGSYLSAKNELKELKELGITCIELMPLNEFSGKFGWGYDGVNLFAPTHLYGEINDLKKFINEAHSLGIGVILDVVYNHFGSDGNFIEQFNDELFLDENNEWGRAINFDVKCSREFFLMNASYWIEEYHFDGLRVDATHRIESKIEPHFLAELSQAAKKAAKERHILVIAENEEQDTRLLTHYGFDGMWNDDFHHSAIVRLTGKREAYYTDYLGQPQEFISCLKRGFLYQGQHYVWQNRPRGMFTLPQPSSSFVLYLQNHDQVANSGDGKRIHTLSDFGSLKAMTALTIIAPSTPMLFQGQEFASSSPFFFFADFTGELSETVKKGRAEFLSLFESLATPEMQANLPNPSDPCTFFRCKLNFDERKHNAEIYKLHKDLIHLKKTDPIFSKNPSIDGAVLGEDAFLIRFFDKDKNDRLLLINLGIDKLLNPAPEPLLAPWENFKWKILWSSESVEYLGQGTPTLTEDIWKLNGHSALILCLYRT